MENDGENPKMSYEEFKKEISNKFEIIIGNIEEDFKVEKTNHLFKSSIILNDRLVKKIYKELLEKEIKSMEIVKDTYYEIPIIAENDEKFLKKSILYNNFDKIIDETNKIEYEITPMSLENCINMLRIALKDTKTETEVKWEFNKAINFSEVPFDRYDIKNEKSIQDIFYKIFKLKTLKITSEKVYDQEKFKNLATSFLFEIMVKNDVGISIQNNLYKALYLHDEWEDNKIKNFGKAPLSFYNKNVINYYKRALAANNAYIKYISYYQVLEYYFDEIFKENIYNDLRSILMNGGFSAEKDKELDKLVKLIKKKIKENGYGNEQESLLFLLKKYIKLEELKDKLNEITPNWYSNNKVEFSGAPKISWNDEKGWLNSIVNRIYKTRNSLVHSKSGSEERYKPYKDDEELKLEIPLIKALAELVIIYSGKPL